MLRWTTIEGSPLPLGVSWVAREQAYNFALFSKHASSVTLLLYREDDLVHPAVTRRLDYLHHKTGEVWHCRVPRAEAEGVRYYAYSVEGPAPSGALHKYAFDPDKVLLDPYARVVFFPPGFDRQAASRPGSNAGKAPLGLLLTEEAPFDWGQDRRPRHQSDQIVYELHVKGFTCHPNSDVSPEKRGTYAGLVEKIPYLKELGVTAVELMPVFQFDPQENNYWGYMPLSFFAPHHGYACKPDQCDQVNEFRALVKALHDADLEVFLDVVYNHTAEGDRNGPTYSYKGIDNSTFYLLTGDPANPYQNQSGTGNTLRTANRLVRKMVLDSLRYWAQEMHVDGFRFDLASVLSRGDDGAINWNDPPIIFEIIADPRLAGLRMIAEPWDAAGAYQLGQSFPGMYWFQWNGRFRDDMRRFVRGDPGLVPGIMTRLYGSDDLFPDGPIDTYRPFQSVNYLTAHDGFTLYDLLSYSQKRNRANGHDNTDGTAEEYSGNCGWEGDENVPANVLALRERQAKNFACLLLLSNGTPMIRAGDEFLQTQGGNNNPYNQDNETTWLNWDRLKEHRDLFEFFRKMIAFRKAHPSIARGRFWREDVRWYGVGADVDLSQDSHTLAYCLHGAARGLAGAPADLYVMINMYWQDLAFTIQEGKAGSWKRVIDTSLPSPDDIREPGAEVRVASRIYVVRNRSVVVLVRG